LRSNIKGCQIKKSNENSLRPVSLLAHQHLFPN
jgi:hypothetical protein